MAVPTLTVQSAPSPTTASTRPGGWRPKRSYRFAHNAVMSLLLFLIAFLFMGIPVFASSGGPPVARHVVVTHRSAHEGGSGILPVKYISQARQTLQYTST